MKSLWAIFFTVLALCERAAAIEFSNGATAGKPLTVCKIDLRKERLRLFLNDDHGVPISQLKRAVTLVERQGQTLVCAMNAGMLAPGGSPLGLFVADGKQTTPLNTGDGTGNFFLKPNGVFVITEAGHELSRPPSSNRSRSGC